MTEQLDRAFAALSDPTRRAILAQLAESSMTVNELVERHHLAQPTISKHLKVLETAGLISRERKAQMRPCRLNPEGLRQVAGWVDRYREFWEGAFERMDALLAGMEIGDRGNE